jgi:hypothetical protein
VPGSGTRNISRIKLRALPDARVVEGEYSPSAFFTGNLSWFFKLLSDYQFYARDLGQPTFPILTIDPTGIVTTQINHTYADGDMIRVLRTLDSSGDRFGGVFQATTPITPKTFVLKNWVAGARLKGKVRKDAQVLVTFSGQRFQIGRVVVTKVGRPSVGYVGRHSKAK